MKDELLPLKVALACLLVSFVLYLILEFAFFWPSSFRIFIGEIWGRAVLVDLYLMLGLFSGWVVYREKTTGRKISWPLVVFSTGSIGVFVYLLFSLAPFRRWEDMPRFFCGTQ